MYHDIKLTKNALDNIERINDADTEYKVIGKPHLRVIVYKNKKSLAVRACVRGHRPIKTLGHYPMMDLRTFERLGDEWYRKKLNQDGHDFSHVDYNQFFYELHLPYLQKKGASDWKNVESIFRRLIKPHLGHLKFVEIKTFDIYRALNSLPDSCQAPASYNRVRSVIHRSFSLGMKFDVCDKNPCTAVDPLVEDNEVERIMSEAETAAFISSALAEGDSLHALCLLTALFTGARISNITHLRKAELASDFSGVKLTKTKTTQKELPLSGAAQWSLKRAFHLSDPESLYVFSSATSKKGHIAYPASAFKRICARAGIATTGSTYEITEGFPIEPLTIHCLRKTMATAVLEHTGSPHLAGKAIGDESLSLVLKRYAFLKREKLADGVNGAADLLTKDIPNFPKIASEPTKACG